MQPTFGSGLQEVLFEQNVNDFESRIEDTINESLEQWLPYVTAEEIDIDASDELRDANRINVSVKFRIGNNTDLNEVTFITQG